MRNPLIYISRFAYFFGTGLIGLSLAVSPSSHAQTPASGRVETAALPRFDVQPDRAAELPQPLTASDMRAYRQAFQLQMRGAYADADAALRGVKNRLLVGHVLAERYLSPRYRSSAEELSAWLREYSDQPDARAIYSLAVRKQGGKATGLTRPREEASFSERASADDLGPSLNRPIPPGRLGMAGPAASLRNRLKDLLGDGKFEAAERILVARETLHTLSAGEIDHFKAMLAAGWFARGDDRQAIEFAGAAAARSGALVPRAHWIAGLAQFRQGAFERAVGHFETLARLPQGQPWDIAAGAFWAARTHLRVGRPDVYNHWLAQAAEHPRTFYGLLAARAFGVDPGLNWNPPPLSQSEIDQLQRYPGAQRVFALLQVGQDRRAEAELRRVYAQSGSGIMRAILAVAMRANMPGLAMRLAREISDLDGRRYDGAFYPIPHWQPIGGYDVDPALVFAFMRVESAFNPSAISPAGARGLMQLMPATAAAMDSRTFRGRLDILLEPEINVTLGQRYIRHLIEEPLVGGELVRLAAAYNGGIGNLSRWKRLQDNRGDRREDALLFIESLPAAETRHFIARLLYSYWMYAERLGQATPSLDLVAQGEWPVYAPPAALAGRPAAPVARESVQPPPPPPALAPRDQVASLAAPATPAPVAIATPAPAVSKLPPPPGLAPRREARARR
ncbi:MAG: lytic transglycosylase domain-containing protein [Rhodospirillales bacterium]|nr:lytic transglycosylase domain-containing protein [Rhodospirillales bacterium]